MVTIYKDRMSIIVVLRQNGTNMKANMKISIHTGNEVFDLPCIILNPPKAKGTAHIKKRVTISRFILESFYKDKDKSNNTSR